MKMKDFCVVCVDDTPEHLKLIVRTLNRHLGYQVIGLPNATECINYTKENPVHLIVTDQDMKGNDDKLNGTDMLKVLKNNNYTGQAIILSREPLEKIGDLVELSKDDIHVIFKEQGYKKELTNQIHNILARTLFKATGDYLIAM